MNELISIIIPVYNQVKQLKKALASIVVQTYKNIEVIVIDDGSTPTINNQQLTISNRLIHQSNHGAPAARNTGLRAATGQYVIFWDADVIAKPRMLETLVRAIEQHPEASYAYCDYRFGWKKMPARNFDTTALKENNYIHSTSLIRRCDLPPDPWDESLKRFQDWDLWLTLLEYNKTGVYVPACLFCVLPHRGGMSAWLPSLFYQDPWRHLPGIRHRVQVYQEMRTIIRKKHKM